MAKGSKGRNKAELDDAHVVVWRIVVHGYGDFLYVGTYDEAAVRGATKASQEGYSRRNPEMTRHRVLTVNEARIYAKHGPDTLDGAPYYGKDE